MSDEFQVAAVYLASPSSTSKPPSTATKLSLYALYKYVTTAPKPTTVRPGMLDWTGRAKWDAWDGIGKELGEGKTAEAEARYCALARECGWDGASGKQEEEKGRGKKADEDVDLDRLDEDDGRPSDGGDAGLGISVSTMSVEDAACASTLVHDAVCMGDLAVLRAELEKTRDVNSADGFGYTPLHLAVDRGSYEAVQLLLEHGARVDVKDQDGMTPRDMADILGLKQIGELVAMR